MELRTEFHRALDDQDISIGALLTVVPEAIRMATAALVAGDRSVAGDLARWRAMVSDLNVGVEHTAEVLIARQSPLAGDLRLLLAGTRLVPLLSDTMDLVADVALPSATEIGPDLPRRVQLVTLELGDTTAAVWQAVEELWRERDRRSLDGLRARHDTLAEVRSTLNAELASGSVDVQGAMTMAMTGRSFERLGRHARAAGGLVEPLVARSEGDDGRGR